MMLEGGRRRVRPLREHVIEVREGGRMERHTRP